MQTTLRFVKIYYQQFNIGKDSISYTTQSELALTCGMSLLFICISYYFYFLNILDLLSRFPSLPRQVCLGYISTKKNKTGMYLCRPDTINIYLAYIRSLGKRRQRPHSRIYTQQAYARTYTTKREVEAARILSLFFFVCFLQASPKHLVCTGGIIQCFKEESSLSVSLLGFQQALNNWAKRSSKSIEVYN